ncbi:unnamed protein product [Ceratitis capitata]|uniref:(Mediterranean fruit fly) hypothetical protein n=1 Tax=Ceratitis capitata TaxID=7213 RepID=A0A811TZ37_CERCA|nr:unnamed protein product [Ceratitis capitata]
MFANCSCHSNNFLLTVNAVGFWWRYFNPKLPVIASPTLPSSTRPNTQPTEQTNIWQSIKSRLLCSVTVANRCCCVEVESERLQINVTYEYIHTYICTYVVMLQRKK